MPGDKCIPDEAKELMKLDTRLLDLLALLYEGKRINVTTAVDRHVIIFEFNGTKLTLDDIKPLEELALASRKVIDRVLRCPKCDNRNLEVKLLCPNCGSTNIERVRIIQHRICGYIDLEINFRRDNQMICPHCHSPILSENDYRVLGTLYYCYNCRTRFHEPDVMLICSRCGTRFRPAEGAYKPVYGLVLTEKARRLIHDAHDFRVALYKLLEERGVRYVCGANLTGSSGVVYEIDFYIPSVKLGIDIEPKITSHNDAVYFALKARDLNMAGHLDMLVVVTREAAKESISILTSNPHIILLLGETPSSLTKLVSDILSGNRR